jgi:hypothetical protein
MSIKDARERRICQGFQRTWIFGNHRWYELPSKKPSPPFEEMADEYVRYYRVNRAPKICAAA